jgi:hypothetical protein
MIFFMVMPALIGGFGKIYMNTIKRYFNTQSNIRTESKVITESKVRTESMVRTE